MKKVFLTMALGLGLMLGGCGESSDQIEWVQFFGSKQAIVQYRAIGADEPEIFTLTCEGPDVETPFKYAWEIDCDLNTITFDLNGQLKVQEWDNPDNDENHLVDVGFEGVDMALGMLTGLALGSSTGTTEKVSTSKSTRTIKATPMKIKTNSFRRR